MSWNKPNHVFEGFMCVFSSATKFQHKTFVNASLRSRKEEEPAERAVGVDYVCVCVCVEISSLYFLR